MAVTEKGRRTRERILEVAADLFHRQGVNATSTGDVMRESNTGKSQFYQHFTDRDDLIAQVFSGHRVLIENMPEIGSFDEVEEWMHQHYKAQASFNFERGCPIGTAAYALQLDQEALREEVAAAFLHMQTNITRFLRREQRSGRYDPEVSCTALARFAIAAVQGGLLLSLLHRRGEPLRDAIDHAMAHLRGYIIS